MDAFGRRRLSAKTAAKSIRQEEGRMRQFRGFLFVMASAALFGCMPIFVKTAVANGGTSSSLVFYRFAVSLPVLFVLMRRQDKAFRPTLPILKKVLVLSTGFCLTPLLLTASYGYISSGFATTIHFIYPIFVLIGCVVFFREPLNRVKILCAALGTGGILFCCGPAAPGAAAGKILALTSGITFAVYVTCPDHSGLSGIPSFALGFLLSASAALISFFASFLDGGICFAMSPFGWLVTVFFSLSFSVGAMMLFQAGVRIIGAQRAAILSTLEPVTSIVIGILFLSEPFSLKSGFGALLVLASVVSLVALDRDKPNPPVPGPDLKTTAEYP